MGKAKRWKAEYDQQKVLRHKKTTKKWSAPGRRKAGTSGIATTYVTRSKALRNLYLSLEDFRKLVILKGIYPREPQNRKKAQHGAGGIKCLYHKKDIAFLSHEPIIQTLRRMKVYRQRVKSAKSLKEYEQLDHLRNNVPFYRLDHIVRERYPSFVDAVRELDDALSLCFLLAAVKKLRKLDLEIVHMSQRLVLEFMLYVIEAQALCKVFISFKGYYYQAEIMGNLVTWIVPHPFAPQVSNNIDMKVLGTFGDFSVALLGFVNFKLYHSLNLYYPPKVVGQQEPMKADEEDELDDTMVPSLVESLNCKLERSAKDDEVEEEEALDLDLLVGVSNTDIEAAKKQEESIERLKNLFSGLRFFLGSETNRESLTFVIRCCKGEVSWNASFFPGATYSESDESITHQIVDRPNPEKKYLSRYYIQPQWVYDSINARMLLPVQKYFPGVDLPPHLSPFVESSEDIYVPPEQSALSGADKEREIPERETEIHEASDDSEDEGFKINERDGDDEASRGKHSNAKCKNRKQVMPSTEDRERSEETSKQWKEKQMPKGDKDHEVKKGGMQKMRVLKGKPMKDKLVIDKAEKDKERKFQVAMISRKKRKIYFKLKKREDAKKKRKNELTESRKMYNAAVQAEKKILKKKELQEACRKITGEKSIKAGN